MICKRSPTSEDFDKDRAYSVDANEGLSSSRRYLDPPLLIL